MAILNQKRILNLIPKTSAPVTIHVSQGDVGTEIEFTLVKGDELFVNTGSLSASVHGVREDGANFGVFTCTLSGSSVKFPLHAEMTAVKGSAIAEIVLVDSQGNKVGSSNFGIMVEESVFPLGVTYDNDVSVYESILAYAQTIPAQVQGEIADLENDVNSLNEALAQEVTNRTNADAAEASARNAAIASEAAAREAADDVLDARIDQIVAPSGEAPSAAEVADARVGVDGVTYNALGTAIRTQVTNLQNNIESFPFEISPNRPKAKAILDIRFTKYPSTDLRLFAIYRNYTTGGNAIYVIALKDANDTQYLLLNVLADNYTEVAPETVVPFSVSGGALEGVYRIDWSVFNASEKYEKNDITKFNKLCYTGYLDSTMTAPGMAANAAAVGERLNNYPYVDKVPNNALKCICDIKFNKYTSRHLRLREIGRSRVVGGNPIHYIQLADENDNLYNLLNVYDSDYTEPDSDAINSFSVSGITGTYKIDWSFLTSGSYYQNNSNPEFKQCCYDGYVDSSLSISNAAADAKAVGDAIGNITGANQLKAVCTPVIYAAVGHPFSLYFKNIFNVDDLDDYNVYVEGVVYNDLECRNYGNRLQFTCETAKTYDITLKLRHNLSNSSIEKALQVVINADVQPTIKAIFIGDSFIQSGCITAEIKNMMQSNITLYGTLAFSAEDSDGNMVTGYNEGRGGWGMRHYWASSSRNGFTNAFYNPVTEHFDFAYYISQNPTFSDVTDIFIMSGANDYQPNRTQNQNISQFITPYRNIVDSIHDYDPNIKIHCMMPINIAGYGYGFNRTVSESGYRYHFTELDLAQKLIEEFEDDTNVFIVPTHVYLDPVYNMAYTEAPVNDRTPIMIDVFSNNVHPNTYGYYAMCDMIYGDIIENS